MDVAALATLTVTFRIDAATLRDAEKQLDAWLGSAADDDRLIEYEVDWARSEWTPDTFRASAGTL